MRKYLSLHRPLWAVPGTHENPKGTAGKNSIALSAEVKEGSPEEVTPWLY